MNPIILKSSLKSMTQHTSTITSNLIPIINSGITLKRSLTTNLSSLQINSQQKNVFNSLNKTNLLSTPLIQSYPSSSRTYASESKKEDTKKDEKKTEENKKEEVKKDEKKTENKKEEKKELDPEFKRLLEEKEKKLSSFQDAYKRSLAEMENIRERTRKEIQKANQFAIQKFAKDLLETSDILKMALDSVPKEMREDKSNNILHSLYTGVSMTRGQLLNSFKKHGVEIFNPMGEKFDANKHQAMFQTEMPDKEPGIIISVQKEGYTLNGRILRPAQVGIVKESSEPKEEKKN